MTNILVFPYRRNIPATDQQLVMVLDNYTVMADSLMKLPDRLVCVNNQLEESRVLFSGAIENASRSLNSDQMQKPI